MLRTASSPFRGAIFIAFHTKSVLEKKNTHLYIGIFPSVFHRISGAPIFMRMPDLWNRVSCKPSVFSKNLTFFSKYAIISHATPGAADSRIKQGVDRIDVYPIPRPVRHPRCHGNAGDHAGTGRGGHRQWRGGAGNQYPVQNLHALSQRTAVPDLCSDLSADRTFSGQTDHAHCPPRL